MSLKALRQAVSDFTNADPEGMSKDEMLELLYDQYAEMVGEEPDSLKALHAILLDNPPTVPSWIWNEFARRKMQFHAKEQWNAIRLWGLFSWGSVSKFLKTGVLKTDMRKENKTLWVQPSVAAYHLFIEPILNSGKSLDEVSKAAGW